MPIYTIGVGSTRAAPQPGRERSAGPGPGVPGRHGEHRRLLAGDRLRGPISSTSNCCGAAAKSRPAPARRSTRSGFKSAPTARSSPCRSTIEPDAPGRFVYQIRAAAPPDDDNPRDNGRESEMDVVDRADARAAGGQRPDARVPLPPRPIAPRSHDEDRRAAANGPGRHVAGRRRHPDRVSLDARGAVSNTTASSHSTPIGRSSTRPRWRCWNRGSPTRRAA